MPQAIVSIDLPTYQRIKDLIAEIEEFKKKWPNDYKDRIGYSSKVDRIMALLPYAF